MDGMGVRGLVWLGMIKRETWLGGHRVVALYSMQSVRAFSSSFGGGRPLSKANKEKKVVECRDDRSSDERSDRRTTSVRAQE